EDLHSEGATAPLWEAARAALRLAAKALDRGRFPQRLRGGPVGGQFAGEFRPSGVGVFACQQASHGGFVADLRETRLLANSGPLVLGYSLASKLPTAASWHDLWETRLLANIAAC
ncbi:hypothetical protein A6D6_01451, partial [Alcanivorax xiamenensis]